MPGGGYPWVVVDKEGYRDGALAGRARASPPSSCSTGWRSKAGRRGRTCGDRCPAGDAARPRGAGIERRICAMGFSAGGHVCADADHPLRREANAAGPTRRPHLPGHLDERARRPCRIAALPARRDGHAGTGARLFAAPPRAGRMRRPPSCSMPRTTLRCRSRTRLMMRDALRARGVADRDASLPRRRPRLRPQAGARQIGRASGPSSSSPGAANGGFGHDRYACSSLALSCSPSGRGAEPRRDRADDAARHRVHGRAGRDRAAMSGPICPTCRGAGARSRPAQMIWVQPPGTATMGHFFLDAFHATGDDIITRRRGRRRRPDPRPAPQRRLELFHRLRRRRPRRGDGMRRSAATPGGWRNSSIMPTMRRSTMPARRRRCSSCCACIWSGARRDIAPPLDRAIGFVLASQYPNGGWPQRWPHDPHYPAYAVYITFNDDVAAENIRFLLMVYRSLGEARVRHAIMRAMDVFLATQQPPPQPGWGLQYTLDLQPAGARSYEPRALVTHTTRRQYPPADELLPADRRQRFLARIPEALDWLESLRLPARSGAARPRLPDLHRDRHQPAALRPPPRLERRQRRLLCGLQPGRAARPLFGVARDRHCRAAARLRRSRGCRADATRGSPLRARGRCRATSSPRSRRGLGSQRIAGGDARRDHPHAQRGGLVADAAHRDQQSAIAARARRAAARRLPHDPCRRRQRHFALCRRPVTGISTATYIANMARLIANRR